MERKVSLCMITKGEPVLNRAIESALPVVDEVVIVDTRPDKRVPLPLPKVYEVDGRSIPVKVVPFQWRKDFSAARACSFRYAKYQFCLWLDSDEILKDAATLRQVFLQAPESLFQIVLRTDYEHLEDGTVLVAQYRERIVPKEYGRWYAPIHEVWCPEVPIPTVDVPDSVFVYHDFIVTDDTVKEKRERNFEIMESLLKSGKAETRLKILYANACIASNRLKEAKTILREIIPTEPRGWSKYRALLILAQCAAREGDLDQVASAAALAHEQVPLGVEAYRLMFEAACIQQRWVDAMVHFEQGYDQGERLHDVTMYLPMQLVPPYGQAAMVCVKLGLFDKAKSYAEKSKNEKLLASIIQALEDEKLGETVETILSDVPESQRRDLCRLLPSRVASYPGIARYLDDELPNDRPSFAIHCGMEGMGGGKREFWGPDDLKEGIGGSEEAVIRLAPELVKAGAHVEVFGPWPKDEVRDGVHWKHYSLWNQERQFTTFVAWRYAGLLHSAPKSSQKVLWLHDLIDRGSGAGIEDADEVWVLSDFHKRHIKQTFPGAKVWVTRNGIPELPPIPAAKDPGYVIYASSPDRGLDNLLDWWPEIKAAVPEANLHIFYGFNQVFRRREKDVPELRALREKVEKAVQELPGIVWHGSVGQDELHAEFGRARVWAYPTEFAEISCITAKLAQGMGVLPVCSAYAALNETVVMGTKFGSVDEPDIKKYKDQFVGAVVEGLKNGDTIDQFAAREFRTAQTWDGVGRDWVNHVRQLESVAGS